MFYRQLPRAFSFLSLGSSILVGATGLTGCHSAGSGTSAAKSSVTTRTAMATNATPILFSANQQSTLQVQVGDPVHYEWNLAGAVAVESAAIADAADLCPGGYNGVDPEVWVASTAQGTADAVVQPCQAGRTYRISLTATYSTGPGGGYYKKGYGPLKITVLGTPDGNSAGASSAAMTVVQGTGQFSLSNFPFSQPLQIALWGDQGFPVAGAQVQWQVVDGAEFVNLRTATSTTDAQGIASANAVGGSLTPYDVPHVSTVSATARINGKTFTQTFKLTSIPFDNRLGLQLPSTQVRNPGVIRARPGEIIRGVIQGLVTANGGPTVQNVALPQVGASVAVDNSFADDPTLYPTAQCVGGTVFTDASGNFACDLQVGLTPGQIPLVLTVGGSVHYSQYSLVVTP